MLDRISNQVKQRLGDNYLLTSDLGIPEIKECSKFTYDIFSRVYSENGSIGKAYRDLGLKVNSFDSTKYLVLLEHRLYLNLVIEQEALWKQYGFRYELRDNLPSLVRNSSDILYLLKNINYSLNQGFIIFNLQSHIQKIIATHRSLMNISQQDFSGITIGELNSRLQNSVKSFVNEYSKVIQISYLMNLIESAGSSTKSLLNFDLLSREESLKTDLYTRSNIQLIQLESDKLAEKYGNRSFNDFEFSAPRWSEDQERIESFKAKLVSAPTELIQQSKEKKDEVTILEAILNLKNNLRFSILNRVTEIRSIVLEIARVRNIKDPFSLTVDELTSTQKSTTETAVVKKSQELPGLIYSKNFINKSSPKNKNNTSKTKQGISISAGKTEGIAKLFNEKETITQSQILILPSTSPNYTHLYTFAKGIIFLKGGKLSHGAIVAREFGIPAITIDINPAEINSKRVMVDGSTGALNIMN